jgi:uncharacterized membrane protein YphA (DoxX/SURF4 family)
MGAQGDSARRPQGIFLMLLRIGIGWHFLYEGVSKALTPGWTSGGYLDASRWVLGDVFQWIAAHPAALQAVDLLNVCAQILIGLLLILGAFTRASAIAGIAFLLLYYVANPPLVGYDFGSRGSGSYLVVDLRVIEALGLAVLAALPALAIFGLDRWRALRRRSTPAPEEASHPIHGEPVAALRSPAGDGPDRRELLANLASLPFLGAFGYALFRKRQWTSWEERNLVDAVTAASTKTLDVASLRELKGRIPVAKVGNVEFSRLILGGNLLSGWAHSRDLIYVSQLVKAYHNKERIFATLLMAERCGVNTLLTNPILCTLIDEYWKRRIGTIQFISDCAGLDYDENGARPTPFGEYLDRVRRAIDYGAAACYIQGETADYYMTHGELDKVAKVMDLVRDNGVTVGIGAHHLETLVACVEAGLVPDFWMKTMHHHGYWSARHPEWHDNMYCNNPDETAAWMNGRPEPWIAFKTMAAGAIHPKEAFRFAFERGADFVCAGMYDFQMVEDVNIAFDVLNDGVPARQRPWRA